MFTGFRKHFSKSHTYTHISNLKIHLPIEYRSTIYTDNTRFYSDNFNDPSSTTVELYTVITYTTALYTLYHEFNK